ncbi:MAG: hypothetical protein ABSE49_07775 [Polyangiaceae bacterium]
MPLRCVLLGSVTLALLTSSAAAGAQHPADPFAREYEVPREEDVGAAAGQFRAIGSGLVGYGRPGAELGLHGTLELMTFAYVGVRASLESTLLRPGGDPMLLAGKIGPSLHLFPYRRVDLSVFFEAGVAGIDLTGNATAMPIVSPGGTLEIWVAPWAFLCGEAHLDWGIYGSSDVPHGFLRLVGVGGLGVAM